MYELHLSKRFTKDAKKLNPQDLKHTMEVLQRLCNNETLEPKYQDHTLSGNLKGARDCHIKPDLVLIYQKDNEILEIVALKIGKHSKIFK
ncbi:type II toxin-antitoxin system YafQ family toxin [Helicobacter didelphidarum]|uniref:Type II toxin-antitoxin system YafQ family toxin n=1 Tax=Helicobacter didelphidarum TaxID=2040648 RepID=A0A3D8IMB6_9HELI|nr:type II toxin-antitoxin system YafQ family toxin [Helicobacter didelphidarum]RDU65784.1 type II toxin-antitoxin system YafQ family toxin [Helicobacter didelphidarum]